VRRREVRRAGARAPDDLPRATAPAGLQPHAPAVLPAPRPRGAPPASAAAGWPAAADAGGSPGGEPRPAWGGLGGRGRGLASGGIALPLPSAAPGAARWLGTHRAGWDEPAPARGGLGQRGRGRGRALLQPVSRWRLPPGAQTCTTRRRDEPGGGLRVTVPRDTLRAGTRATRGAAARASTGNGECGARHGVGATRRCARRGIDRVLGLRPPGSGAVARQRACCAPPPSASSFPQNRYSRVHPPTPGNPRP
jgi:hypothetical protein